jgi:preprotein translocase subunit SecB
MRAPQTASTTPATTPAEQPAKKQGVRILAQYVKDFSFTSPKAPASLRNPGEAPGIQVEVGIGQSQLEADVYEVVVNVKGTAASKTNIIYDLKLSFGGLFEISGMRPQDIQPILFVNCPALLFPFLRQLVGDMTRAGGFSPIWLDPIDWGGLYAQRIAELRDKQGNGAAAVN